MSAEPVLVAGAGLAGLTTALALARRGFDVRLCERAGTLEEVGAGLQLSPNALRALERFGLLPALRARGVEATHVSLRDLGTGRRLARVPVRGEDGTPYLSIRRADLQAVLAGAVSREPSIRLDLGAEVIAFEGDGPQCLATLRLRDGTRETVRSTFVIAADGVRSAIGTALGKPAATPSGDVAWRMTLAAGGTPPRGIEAWLGSSCHAVAYPIDAGASINLVLVLRDGIDDPRAAIRRADPRLRDMVERSDAATRWPLATADRRWTAGDPPGLIFVGDAAHAMLPYAAQGAALAIEDAVVLASCLSDAPSPEQAGRTFEAVRRPRWDRVRRRVAFHRTIYHLPPPFTLGRNLAMRMKSEASLGSDLAWLYDWRPPER